MTYGKVRASRQCPTRRDIKRRQPSLNRRTQDEKISDCIGARRHFGGGHNGHPDFCACLLAGLGLGTWGAGARTDDSCARATGLCLLSRLFLRLRVPVIRLCQLRLRLSVIRLCQLWLRLSGLFLWLRLRRLLSAVLPAGVLW